jgi:hypothetical protein
MVPTWRLLTDRRWIFPAGAPIRVRPCSCGRCARIAGRETGATPRRSRRQSRAAGPPVVPVAASARGVARASHPGLVTS